MKHFLFLSFLVALSVLSAGETDLMKGTLIFRGSSFKARKAPRSNEMSSTCYFDKICDGDSKTGWQPMEARGPHFIEMLWRHPVCADQMDWETQGITHGTLSSWEKGKWLPVAEITQQNGQMSFPKTSSARWRFEIDKFSESPVIYELKLKGPEQYLLPKEILRTYVGKISISDVQIPERTYTTGDRVKGSFKVTFDQKMDSVALMIEIRPRESQATLMEDEASAVTTAVLVQPDQDGKVLFDMELPPWTPQGKNDLMVTAVDKTTSKQAQLAEPYLASVNVQRPGFPEMPEPMKTVSLGKNTDGQLGICINGKWHPAFFNRFYGTADPERYGATTETGFHIMYWQCRVGLPFDEDGLKYQLDWFDRRIKMALAVNPQNYFILSADLKARMNWRRAHPSELMLLEDGSPNPQDLFSFGSELYNQQVEHYLVSLIRFIKAQPYGDRVIGYHVWSCTQNDGFVGGAYPNRRIRDRKDFLIGDYNPGAIKQFRNFLRKKYNNNPAALQNAWHNANVTFDTAYVSREELVRQDPTGGPFRDPVASRPAIDYLEFIPHLIGDFNRRVAAIIKRETNGQALVLTHAGAVKCFLTMSNLEQLQSGNHDFAEMLEDPNIDMYVQAQNYATRDAGNPVTVYQPTASIALHDKLYLFDYDPRTLSAGTLKYCRHRSQYETKAIFERDFGYQWIDNAGAWISDMSKDNWHIHEEYGMPWFTMPEVTTPIRETLRALQKNSQKRHSAAEIAVILSLKSPRYEDACRMDPLYKALVSDQLYLKTLPYLGAPHDVFLSTDLGHPRMKDYKLYVFLNPTYFSPAERAEIEKLKRNGKVLAWFYAPGYATDEGLSLEAITKLTGFNLKMRSADTEVPELVYTAGSPLSLGLEGKKLTGCGWNGIERFSPAAPGAIFYTDDDTLSTIAGRYADHTVAFAARDFHTWKSVWCGVPNFELGAWVNLCRYAGVHLYAKAPVVLYCDNRMMMLHNGYETPQDVTVSLPRKARVTDLMTGKTVTEDNVFTIRLGTPETRLLQLEYR